MLKEEHTALERKLARVRSTRTERFQQAVDEARLTAEAGQQGDIDIAALTRLAPPLHGEATDDRRTPAVLYRQALQVRCRSE